MSGKGMVLVGAAAVGAALALAGPAVAESPNGDYTVTVTEAVGKNGPPPVGVGTQFHWEVVPCGPGCLNANGKMDYHMVGNLWTGSGMDGCEDTINAEFTSWTSDCRLWTVKSDLTKDG